MKNNWISLLGEKSDLSKKSDFLLGEKSEFSKKSDFFAR
jgi:hypothetical protein